MTIYYDPDWSSWGFLFWSRRILSVVGYDEFWEENPE